MKTEAITHCNRGYFIFKRVGSLNCDKNIKGYKLVDKLYSISEETAKRLVGDTLDESYGWEEGMNKYSSYLYHGFLPYPKEYLYDTAIEKLKSLIENCGLSMIYDYVIFENTSFKKYLEISKLNSSIYNKIEESFKNNFKNNWKKINSFTFLKPKDIIIYHNTYKYTIHTLSINEILSGYIYTGIHNERVNYKNNFTSSYKYLGKLRFHKKPKVIDNYKEIKV
jgi:hypothetical protein